jgi:hypothetical protein
MGLKANEGVTQKKEKRGDDNSSKIAEVSLRGHSIEEVRFANHDHHLV